MFGTIFAWLFGHKKKFHTMSVYKHTDNGKTMLQWG